MAKGCFIVSLDCEGKWGMADHLTQWHHAHLNRAELTEAYRTLAALFGRYDIAATFAFVMAFVLSADEQASLAERFGDTEIEGSNWLSAYRSAQRAGDLSGWTCPEALEIVRDAAQHEVACHGFTHLPLAEKLVSRADAEREFAACAEAARMKGLSLETFVYPRNLEGHKAALAAAGFKGFRKRPAQRGKLGALFAELNSRDRAQMPLRDEAGMVAIPSGEMLNWQNGARKLVPRAASRMRWASRLRDAAETGGVAHLWLHPHNLIDAPGTRERLEDVLAEAARLRAAGRIEVLTQAQYCAERRASAP